MHVALLPRRSHLQRRHIPAHRARGDRAGQRQQQPPNPLRRHPPVLGQPLRDLLPPRVQAAHPRRRHPHRRPRLLQGAADRLDVQLQSSRNSLLRHALHQIQVADLDPLRHSDHLRVLLAVSTRRPCLVTSIVARKLLVTGCSGGPFSRGHGVPFHLAATNPAAAAAPAPPRPPTPRTGPRVAPVAGIGAGVRRLRLGAWGDGTIHRLP